MKWPYALVQLINECRCEGKGYIEIPYVISVMRKYCTCPEGVAYKARSLKAMGL